MSDAKISTSQVVDMMMILDADGDGTVDRDEFKSFYVRANPGDDFDKVWADIDLNGDNELSMEELCIYYGINVEEAQAEADKRRNMTDEEILEQLGKMSEDDVLKKLTVNTAARGANTAARGAMDAEKLKQLRGGVTMVKMAGGSGMEVDFLQECELGDGAEVDRLMAEGVKVRLEDEKAEMPFHKLAKHGATELITKILARPEYAETDVQKCDLNHKDKQGYTPLLQAVAFSPKYAKDKSEKATRCVKYLLNMGSDLFTETSNGWNVLHVCAHNDALDVLKAIFEWLDKQTVYNRKMINDFVNHGDKDGRAPLHIAAFRSSTPLVEYLVAKGADPTNLDANGISTMSLAQKSGRTKSQEILEEAAKKAEEIKAQNMERRKSIG